MQREKAIGTGIFMPGQAAARRDASGAGSGGGGGGGGAWTPALAGYVLFLDGDRGVFDHSDGTVASTNTSTPSFWTDQSGNGNNVASNGNETSGNTTYTTAALNGHNIIAMNGSQGGLRSVFTLTQPCHVFLVVKATWTASTYFFDGGSADAASCFCNGTTPGNYRRFAGTGVNDTVATSNNTWFILANLWSGASSLLRVNAGTAATSNPGAGNPGGFTVGSSGNRTGGPLVGSYAAVLVYPSALSTSDETIVRNDLNARFAIF